MKKKRISICYVDDDNDEVERFKGFLPKRVYTVGAGTTLRDALKELKEKGISRPDVVFLDLYYGRDIDPEKRKAIALADNELTAMEHRVAALLLQAGQSPKEGFQLADDVNERFPGVPIAFFSRKAFLKDALTAQEKGFPLLEKPDPDDSDKKGPDPYTAALKRSAREIASRIDSMVHLNTWWERYGEWIRGFALGCFFLLAGFLWEIAKLEISLNTKLVLSGGVVVVMIFNLVVAWPKRS